MLVSELEAMIPAHKFVNRSINGVEVQMIPVHILNKRGAYEVSPGVMKKMFALIDYAKAHNQRAIAFLNKIEY